MAQNDFPDIEADENVGGAHRKRKGKGEDFLRSRAVISAPELMMLVSHLQWVLEHRELWIAHLEAEMGTHHVDELRKRKKLGERPCLLCS